jgi:hypothetical protein
MAIVHACEAMLSREAVSVRKMVLSCLRSLAVLGITAVVFMTEVPGAIAQTALTLSRGPGNVEILEFSLEDLRNLPQTTIETENEFTDGRVAYRGPLVREVLERLALDQADTIRFTAVNDYYVDVPTSDFMRFDAILALEADGKPLSRRDKGPIWLMYPISDHEALQAPIYVNRLIWQIYRIESL